MLSRLYVKNFALIEEADIYFNEKFNVLSGETGSGKSIILDSVNFVLGSKADKALIRYGESEAYVKAEFTVDENSDAAAVLKDMDIDCDGAIIISRKFGADGKGSIKINGNSVTVSMLRKLTQKLVDVYGQSEHFFLLEEQNQLKTVDYLCGERATQLKKELAGLISQKRQYKREIAEFGGSEQERAQTLDLLSYQINEIEKADIKAGELEELTAKKKLIENSEKILTALSAIKGALTEDNGCGDVLAYALRQAGAIADYDEKYGELYSRLDNLCVEAGDIGDEVSSLSDDISFDGDEARRIDERLYLLKNLIKKYGPDEQSVLDFAESAKKKYDSLINAAETVEKLNKSIEECNKRIYSICRLLTKERKCRCEKLSENIESELKSLNIPNAKFDVQFNDYDEQSVNNESADGSDKICFMFSANRGEPLKPLDKVISGGELSRFMLAIKSQLRDLNGISTYIFDEIDAGISGETARTVAEKFAAIGKNTQVIAVSHLPQVCAAADAQYLIFKSDDGEKTVSQIKQLDRGERIKEIMRLTGNTNTQASKTHAEELLAEFGN